MSPAPLPWTPLAEGETAARAFEAVEAIARDLEAWTSSGSAGFDLNGGKAGAALFFSYLQRARSDGVAGERAELLLDQAITLLGATPMPAANLYNGFSGLAWVVEHVEAAGEEAAAGVESAVGAEGPEDLEEDEDLNSGIDAALHSILQRCPWDGEFDLLGGLVGYGVYALERLPRPSAAALLPLIVERLSERAERTGKGEGTGRGTGGLAWYRWDVPGQAADPGMAHGAAGVIALLARILREGGASPQAASLLEAAVEGVLDPGSAPPGSAEELAWCAGNAGLSVALLAAGRAAGRADWEGAALDLALAATGRRVGADETFDPALCHGTSGLSHLFHRLHQATGDVRLREAAVDWLERTLARRRAGQGVGGFLRRGRLDTGGFGWLPDPGFLGGSAGIGLALLAASTLVEPAWDRLLLLSGR